MKEEGKSFGNFVSNLNFLKSNNLIGKEDRILEIGSGEGKLLSTLLNEGYSIEGVELSPDNIKRAKEIYGNALPIQKVDDYKLPYPENTFDVVISFDVLEHIPDTDSHLQEVSRVLKDNGRYCFGIPNRLTDEPFCIWAYKSFSKYKKPGAHCSLHTYWAIKRRLRKNNYEVTTYNQKQDTKWIRDKVFRHFGSNGLRLFNFVKIDRWPIWLKPTIYVEGESLVLF